MGHVFIIGIITVGIVLCALLVFFLFRVRHLLGSTGSSQCAARKNGGRWHTGIIFFREEQLEWYGIISLSLKPQFTINRRTMDTAPQGTVENTVFVGARTTIKNKECTISLAMDAPVHNAMVAWADSAPPLGETVLF